MVVFLPIFCAIYYLAFWLRYEGSLNVDGVLGENGFRMFRSTVLWAVGLKTFTFWGSGVYKIRSRYITTRDVVNLAKAVTISSIGLALVDYLIFPKFILPRSVFLIDWGSTILVVCGFCAGIRMVRDSGRKFRQNGNCTPTFIIGANEAGAALLRMIERDKNSCLRIVGFLDDHPHRIGTRINGVPVLGALDQMCSLAEDYGVSEVLLPADEIPGKTVRQLMEAGNSADIQVQVLPSYQQLLSGKVEMKPRPVCIEDLLGREPVQLDMQNIRNWMDDRVLMVTGSAGSIGSEICRQLLQFSPRKLVLVDRSENSQFYLERELIKLGYAGRFDVVIADINDSKRIRAVMREYQPDILFHAAAYKHVPLMEGNPGEAVKNIALATKHLADLAEEFAVGSFVMISSDKAVNPTNVMGANKRIAELYVQSLAAHSRCHFVTVRFGNVLGSAGSVVPIFTQQIQNGGPVTVTDERMQRYFMTIPEASQLVIQAGAMGRGGEIFVLDMGEPVRIVDLATDLVKLSGLKVGEDIEIQFTGLRPGEKLYEELHVDGEKHLPTRHPKIMVAEKVTVSEQFVHNAFERLASVTEQPSAEILAEIQRILPEFQSAAPQQNQPTVRRAA
ncbi:UDP-N-acetyl-alpha-D-glucosamine C6 dehydratase [Gimesia panareensis]|uniref:UDP-N-acetyl-alpha-D-glucosamine C6 dehydratase n=2 Tax=Gimesia panareensis TaxID=2527978 RepID=A0A517QG08_9PLAN|nr:UDP-N-acetyl-alpha-D-glucosamine C6 dehydratase [Gimesia panareensis]QDU53627.1 UDP-N-acetyl-alpha-D-glucosamine C6 dehydratase [Gimesia panareensis]